MKTKKILQWLCIVVASAALTACAKKDDSQGGTTPSGGSGGGGGGGGGGGTASTPPPRRDTTPPPAQELTAAQIVDKAIAAHGGLANIKAKLTKVTVMGKGVYKGMPYTSVVHSKAPTHHMMVIKAGGKTMMEMGHTPTDCWNKRGPVVIPCSDKAKKYWAVMNKVGYMSLVAPLKDAGVKLEKGGMADLEGKPQYVIKAEHTGTEVTFWFDKATFRLSGYTWTGVWDEHMAGGQPGKIVGRHFDYKMMDGVLWPMKWRYSFNGKTILEEETTDAKLGTVDESKFQKPAQLKFGALQVQMAPKHHAAWHRLTIANAEMEKQMPGAVMALYKWVMQNKIKPLPAMPSVHFIKVTRRKTTVEIRIGVVKPAGKAPAAGKKMGIKQMKAQKYVWALQQGPFKNSQKWLKALRLKAKKKRMKINGPGAMQAFTDPRHTSPAQSLSAVIWPVKGK